MKRIICAVAAALVFSTACAAAKPFGKRGGHPSSGGGVAQACDPAVPTLCAEHKNGQTFVTWDDLDTDAAGDAYRYKVYRSASPITSGNYGSAELRGDYILNNSAQLVGGDPTNATTATVQPWNASYRQDGTHPGIRLSDLGTPLAAFTGLFAHTATGTENAHYAVVAFPTAGGADTYIGSVGPIAETTGDRRPYKQYDDTDARVTFGQIGDPAGLPVNVLLHASSNIQGCSILRCGDAGEYWAWLMGANEGHWQDGLMRTANVYRVNTSSFPGGNLEIRPRETIFNPLGTTSLEGFWNGLGMTPLSYVGPADRKYTNYAVGLERQLAGLIAHYGADSNRVYHQGNSMGAMALLTTSKMTNPRFAASFPVYPVWQMHLRPTGSWAGATWNSTWPFKATVAAAPSTLGTTATSVLLPDGATWGGTGNYTDLFAVIADLGQDFPPVYFGINKEDSSILGFGTLQMEHQLDALGALKASNRAHAMAWTTANHDQDPAPAIDCDRAPPTVAGCTSRAHFRLDRAHLAFANSSIDDNPGTATRDVNNIMDGDKVGVINGGFQWTIITDTAGSFEATVDNTWMDQPPTPVRQTTLAGSGEVIPASGTINGVAVTDSSVLTTGNPYWIIGDNEIVQATLSGGAVNITARARLETAAKAHNAGETIRQIAVVPTGPNAGPFSTMTVDIAIWNLQDGAWGGKTCVFTADGDSPTAPQTPTILSNGVPLFTGVTINSTGATAIACS